MNALFLLIFLIFAAPLPLTAFSSEQEPAIHEFNIDDANMSSALLAFSQITGHNFIAATHFLKSAPTASVKGRMLADEAMVRLLSESKLTFRKKSDGSYLILRRPVTKASAPRNTDAADPLDETVVITGKREQYLHDIAASVSAYQGDDLRTLGISNVRQLNQVAPSLSYHGAISSAGQSMRIRGIGSGVIATGIEQSVNTIIDGIVTGPSGSGLEESWDVKRIEVMRGPQGTLFGKNVSAGAIHIITNEPTDHFEAALTLRNGLEKTATRTDTMLNLPLSEDTRFRISGFYMEQDGDVDNIIRQQTENKNQRTGVRLQLHHHQNRYWSKLNLSYARTDDRCCARVFSASDEGLMSDFVAGFVLPALNEHEISVNADNRTAITDGDIFDRATTWHGMVELGREYASGHQIKSISGYRNWRHRSRRDADNLNTDIVWVSDERELNLFTQELQLLSPPSDHREYILGLYYYEHRLPSTEYIGGGMDFNGTRGITTVDSEVNNKNLALFAHYSHYPRENLTLSIGARVIRESLSARGQQGGDHWIWPAQYPENTTRVKDRDFMGTVGVQYYPDINQQWFFNITRGYKGPAIDNTSNSIFFRAPVKQDNNQYLTANDAVLAPETVLNYELGQKSYFLAQTLYLSSHIFFSRFSNFQSSAYDGNTNAFRLQNAGEIRSTGLELEASYRPWDDTKINLSAAWIDARFHQFKGAPCQIAQQVAGTCSSTEGGQNISGQRLNQTPKLRYFVQYHQDIYHDALPDYVNVHYTWQDDVVFDQDLDPNTEQKAYGLLGFRLGWFLEEHFRLDLFGHNVLDERYADRIIDAPIWQGTFQQYPGAARTTGLEIEYLY